MVLLWKLILLLSLVSDAKQITSRFCTRSNKDAKNCSHIIEWWVTQDSLQEGYLWLKHSKFILYLYMYKFNYHWWQAQALHLRDTGTIQSVFPSRLSSSNKDWIHVIQGWSPCTREAQILHVKQAHIPVWWLMFSQLLKKKNCEIISGGLEID